MSYTAKVIKVMLASPGDVEQERAIMRDVIHAWNAIHSQINQCVLLPIGWETHAAPAMGDRAQEIINKQILRDCDLLIAAFWTRIGSPTGNSPSGTVEEISEHIEADKPAMIYFSSKPVHLDSVDQTQYSALTKFKAECRDKGLIENYESLSAFKDKLSRQLAQTINSQYLVNPSMMEAVAKSPPSTIKPPNLSDSATKLLQIGSQDPNGIILRIRHMGGTDIQCGNVKLLDNGNAREAAKWESAINELENYGLIEDRNGSDEVFHVTHYGYNVADVLTSK